MMEKKIAKDILMRANVVLATTVGVGSEESSLKHHSFDWVVIDEAAQGLEAACWVCIQKGKKV
jgi:superfamily I DNA and/or RNA helicase